LPYQIEFLPVPAVLMEQQPRNGTMRQGSLEGLQWELPASSLGAMSEETCFGQI